MSGFNHCFSTLGCSELSLHQVADLAGRNGIETVELRALSGTLDLPAALAAEFRAPDGLAAFLTQRKLRVAALNTSVRLFDGADLSAIEPFVAWAEAAGADHLRVFDGGGRLSRAALDRAADWLEAWQADRRSRGLKVDLMIETHDALADYGQLVAFVERARRRRGSSGTRITPGRGAPTWKPFGTASRKASFMCTSRTASLTAMATDDTCCRAGGISRCQACLRFSGQAGAGFPSAWNGSATGIRNFRLWRRR